METVAVMGSDLASGGGICSAVIPNGTPTCDVFPIMNLPVELRGIVFKQFGHAHQRLRLVCKQWREEIDHLCKFSVSLNDYSAKLPRPYELHVDKCNWFVKDKQMRILPTKFTYPKELKVLKIKTPTTQQVLNALIGGAEKLELLKIRCEYYFLPKITAVNCPQLVELSNLKTLILKPVKSTMPRVLLTCSVLDFPSPPLVGCYFPSLEKLHLEIYMLRQHGRIFVPALLDYIGKHYISLRRVSLKLYESHWLAGQTNSVNLDAIDLTSLCRLRLLELVVRKRIGPDECRIWKQIMEVQDSLEVLSVDLIPINNVFMVPNPNANSNTMATCRAPIINCSLTLVTVNLFHVQLLVSDGSLVPFDLDVFSSCYVLQTLLLSCPANKRRIALQPLVEEVHLIGGGSNLPVSLKSIELMYFHVLASSLRAMLRKCRDLTKLCLSHCGKHGNLGVTYNTIVKMAKLKDLQQLRIDGFNVSTFGRKSDFRNFILSNATLARYLDEDEKRMNIPYYAHRILKALKYKVIVFKAQKW